MGARLHRLSHRPNVGKQVRVRQHDTFRIARAARCVLDENRVTGRGGQRLGKYARFAELGERDDRPQILGEALQESSHRADLGVGDEQARLSIAQNAGLPPHMVLDLRAAEGRIDRHRDRARHHDSEKGEKELGTGRQHDGNAFARLHTTIEQPRRRLPRSTIEFAISDRPLQFIAEPEADMRPFLVRFHMQRQDLEKGCRQARLRRLR